MKIDRSRVELAKSGYGRGYAPLGAYSGPGRFASPWEGLIRDDDEWRIDRGFFGLSHDEMMQASPLVRMLLGCTAETLERAGWSLQSMRNTATGVFLGAQVPAVANFRKPGGVDEHSVAGVSLAIPSRIRGATVLAAPTSPRLTVHAAPPRSAGSTTTTTGSSPCVPASAPAPPSPSTTPAPAGCFSTSRTTGASASTPAGAGSPR